MKRSLNRILIAITAALAIVPLSSQANNGHFMVDHAVIADPGSCQLESWINRDDTNSVNRLVTVPACTLALGWQLSVPVHYHMSDSEVSGFGLEGKTIIASAPTFGAIAVTLGSRYDRRSERLERNYINMPWSAEIAPNLIWHLNAGFSHRRANSNFYGTWGMAATYEYSDAVDLVAEIAAVGSDSPSVAVGTRFHLTPGWELDFSIGRDNDRRHDFANVGINIRF